MHLVTTICLFSSVYDVTLLMMAIEMYLEASENTTATIDRRLSDNYCNRNTSK